PRALNRPHRLRAACAAPCVPAPAPATAPPGDPSPTTKTRPPRPVSPPPPGSTPSGARNHRAIQTAPPPAPSQFFLQPLQEYQSRRGAQGEEIPHSALRIPHLLRAGNPTHSRSHPPAAPERHEPARRE